MEINGKAMPHREAYGPEWEKEIGNLSKSNIIQRLRTKAKEVDRLDNIAQTKCGENMKLTVEREGLRNALENGMALTLMKTSDGFLAHIQYRNTLYNPDLCRTASTIDEAIEAVIGLDGGKVAGGTEAAAEEL